MLDDYTGSLSSPSQLMHILERGGGKPYPISLHCSSCCFSSSIVEKKFMCSCKSSDMTELRSVKNVPNDAEIRAEPKVGETSLESAITYHVESVVFLETL